MMISSPVLQRVVRRASARVFGSRAWLNSPRLISHEKGAVNLLFFDAVLLLVMIERCQRLDPGSIPGRRTNL